jgi:hypothetical protein
MLYAFMELLHWILWILQLCFNFKNLILKFWYSDKKVWISAFYNSIFLKKSTLSLAEWRLRRTGHPPGEAQSSTCISNFPHTLQYSLGERPMYLFIMTGLNARGVHANLRYICTDDFQMRTLKLIDPTALKI